MTNEPVLLKDRMSLGNKFRIFIDYLQGGGELEIDNRIWVWLDSHITREEMDDNGRMQYFGIDGLANKCIKIAGEETDHYLGQNDLPFHYIVELLDKITEQDWLGMTASLALRSMNTKRR